MTLEESSSSVIIKKMEEGANGKKLETLEISPRSQETRSFGKLLLCTPKKPRPRKILWVLLFCAALFCFGVVLIQLVHLILKNRESSQPSMISQNNSSSHSNVNVMVKILADPCEDFYEFACESIKSQKERQDVEISDEFEEYFQETRTLILGSSDAQNRAEEKSQNFYKSCLKAVTNLESMAFNTELEKMLEKLDKIPHGNLQEKLELLQNEYGLSPLFAWGVNRDVKDSSKNFIQIVQKEPSFLGVGQMDQLMSLLNKSDDLKIMIVKILGNRLNFTGKSNDFDQLVKLEKEIRGLMQPPLTQQLDDLNRYNSMNFSQMQNLAGFINWKKFFNIGFQNVNMTIDDNEKIVVWCPRFLLKLSKKLEVLQNSPEGAKLLNKYLIFQVGKELLGKIFIALNHSTAAPEFCSYFTEGKFKLAVASMIRRQFLKENPDFETKSMEMVQEMAENIRAELVLVLKEAEWLDETSRKEAVEKARKTQVLIGFPEGVKNPKVLEQYYELTPKMNESDFLGNILGHSSAEMWKSLKTLTSPADINCTFDCGDEDRETMGDTAFHIPNLNIVSLPVRNLLLPYFDPKSLTSFNYGRLGFTIAHEFFHGFSQFGSNWDGDAKFLNQSLWETEDTKKEMENRSNCLIRQYSKFAYPDGKSLNGTQTLEENFADNIGFDIVTRAFYRRLSSCRKKTQKLGKDGKNMTLVRQQNEQSFFLSFAKRWCTEEPPEFSMDPHSPHKFRVLGTLQNSRAFANAFNCPLNSRMNPQEKCSVF